MEKVEEIKFKKGYKNGHIPWNKGTIGERIKMICVICKKEKEVVLSKKDSKYCSKKCKNIAMKTVLKGRGSKQKILIICNICKKRFLVFPCKKDSKYCSQRCFKKGLEKKVVLICKNCNKNFKVWLSNKNRKFCSKECEVKYCVGVNHRMYGRCGEKSSLFGIPRTREVKEKLRNANLGEKSHFWKGGVSLLADKIRKLPEYKKWRKKVYLRDNFTCQMFDCDETENFLNVHHIEEFNIIVKDSNIESTFDAIECEELWDVNNGITLCRKCHNKIRGEEREYKNLFINIIK